MAFTFAALLFGSVAVFAQGVKSGGLPRTSEQRESYCPKEAGRENAPPDASEESDGVTIVPVNCTPLMRAAENGSTETVKAQIAEGADVNAKTRHGMTALMLAAEEGYLDIVKLLIAAGADVNAVMPTPHAGVFTVLTEAVLSGNKDVVVALIDAGAEVNPRPNSGRLSPLFFAISPLGSVEMIKTLLAKGADVNFNAGHGLTPIMVAAMEGSPEVVRALAEAGADLNAKCDEGATALSLAKEAERDDLVRVLKKLGAKEQADQR